MTQRQSSHRGIGCGRRKSDSFLIYDPRLFYFHSAHLRATLLTKLSYFSSTAKNCAELHRSGQRISGIYTIKTDNSEAFDVYCDQTTDGGGWTVFQRRLNGSVDFNRSWSHYKHGFGSFLAGEFWLGLDKVHRLTQEKKSNTLRVDLGDDSKNIVYAEYKWFGIANEADKYQLKIGNLASKSINTVNGLNPGVTCTSVV